MIKGLLTVIFFWIALKYMILHSVHIEHIGMLKTHIERYQDGEDYSEFEGRSNQVP